MKPLLHAAVAVMLAWIVVAGVSSSPGSATMESSK